MSIFNFETVSEYLSLKSILLCAILGLIGYQILSWMFKKTPKNLPPGPRGWGTNWTILKATWNDSFLDLTNEWAKKYGEITFVYSLGQPLALLNSPEITRKLFTSEEYKHLVADRLTNAASRLAWYNGKDLIFSKFDAVMRKKRRMFYNVIGLYGEGVEKFENIVWIEMERMFAEIEKFEGKDIDFASFLSRSLKIIIYVLALGELPPDPTTPDILEEYDISFNKLWAPDIDFVISNIPFLTKIPGKYKRAVDRLTKAKKAAEDLIYFNPKKGHVAGQPRGIADLLFEQQQKPGNEWMENDPEHVIAFLTSLFFAAHLTSRASILGIFLCLINYPDVTNRVQAEVDRVIGTKRPKLEHKMNMPYTEATILEALRLISQSPLSSLRTASADIHFDGMTIPKNTLVFMNNWYFFHDEKFWEDPWTFKPERFLDNDGNILPKDHIKRRNLMPFGAGVRACPGERFARSRVFLFLTSTLQQFDILPPVNEKLVPADFRSNHEEVKGFVRQILPYKCRLVRRHQRVQ